jgi:hypothetical protein
MPARRSGRRTAQSSLSTCHEVGTRRRSGGIPARGSGHVPKHCSAEELIIAVRRVLRGETHLSPMISRDMMEHLLRSGTSARGKLTQHITSIGEMENLVNKPTEPAHPNFKFRRKRLLARHSEQWEEASGGKPGSYPVRTTPELSRTRGRCDRSG